MISLLMIAVSVVVMFVVLIAVVSSRHINTTAGLRFNLARFVNPKPEPETMHCT